MKTFTFDALTDTQKQTLAEKWCNDVAHFNNQTPVVEYILNKSHEDDSTPFSYEDTTNNGRFGTVEINGSFVELTEDERDEKLKFYEYLRDKAENLSDTTIQKLREVDSNNKELIERLEKCAAAFEERYYGLDGICDDLKYMDFDEKNEIYQWFSCDSYAASKLCDAGECVLDGEYWGRQACGQAIYLDCCIQKVAFDYYCDYNESFITQDTIEAHKLWSC